MDACILATDGDLSISVDIHDAQLSDAVQLLGTVCNEIPRMNMALTMQEQG